jgi:hypothetical protein
MNTHHPYLAIEWQFTSAETPEQARRRQREQIFVSDRRAAQKERRQGSLRAAWHVASSTGRRVLTPADSPAGVSRAA